MNRARPWLVAGAYVLLVALGVGVGYFYWSLRLSVPAVTAVILTAWCIWLTADRWALIDLAEQAADHADRVTGQYTILAEQVDTIAEHLWPAVPPDAVAAANQVEELATEPIPIQPPTVPMAEAWDSSAADLTAKAQPEGLETRMHTREFSGREFRFRS